MNKELNWGLFSGYIGLLGCHKIKFENSNQYIAICKFFVHRVI